jgi:hypothetical protein
MAITGRIRAVTKPKQRLDVLARNALGEVVTFMDAHLDRSIKRLQQYPPPRPGSRYVRTYTLRGAWRNSGVRLTREGLVGSVSNDAIDPYGSHYAELVHGDDAGMGQLGLHRGTGWPLMAEVLRTGYRDGVKRAIQRGLG